MSIEPTSGAVRAAMRVTLPIVMILTLTGAYALGRMSVDARRPGQASESDVASLASFRESLEQPDALERSYRFHGFLQTLSADNVGEAARILENRNPWLVEDELLNFMIAWAGFDAPAAFEWARSRTPPFRKQATAAAFEGWAFHDPVAARQTLEAMDGPGERATFDEFVVAGWLKGGRHQGVTEYIMDQPAGTARQRFTNLLTIELMRGGPEAVVEWAESIPDDAPDSYKPMAFQKAANILATEDPIQASAWIERHLGQSYAEDAPSMIGRRWLELDPTAALDWLASLPSSQANHDALRTVLRVWLAEAPAEAMAWVQTATEAGRGGAAIEVMISRYADNPPQAIAWAQRISDPAERLRTTLRIGRTWHRRNPQASERWIEESDLSPQLQSAILNPSVRPRSNRRAGPAADEAAPRPAS